jgi:peptidoglycan/LPS O-acetylase OafA/YrhL
MESSTADVLKTAAEQRHPRKGARGGYIPSLDGLRAISIMLVLLSHLGGTRNFVVPERATSFFELGHLGVRVFFVISGFLITNLLLHEIVRTGRVHLGKFYFRRTLRIFPPYYVLILSVALMQAAHWLTLAPHDLLHAVTYTSNYYPERSWYVGHTWSLSVEEQFYLLWPAVILLAGRRRALWAALAFVILSPALRLAIYYHSREYPIGHTFETVADSIAVGCLLAGTREWLKRQTLYRRLLGSRLFPVVPVCVLLASALYDRPRLYVFFGFTIMNVGIALCVDWCVTNYDGRLGRLLNTRPLVFLGVMSYSIYLWQQLFLDKASTWATTHFPFNLLMVALCALASYYLVERPSLNLRQRLERRIFAGPPRPTEQPAVSAP